MPDTNFPELSLDKWRGTRDTIHAYTKVMGAVREALAPRTKHWWHISLRPGVTGLVTPPITAGGTSDSFAFTLELNLMKHELVIATSKGDHIRSALNGQSVHHFCDNLLKILTTLGIKPEIDQGEFQDNTEREYDPVAANRFWQALGQIAMIFEEFKSGMREETSPTCIWSHHFDMAFVWFSGNLIPDIDPSDEEMADAQMSFGFSTGDEGLAEPYFYISAYPMPEELKKTKLPAAVSWQSEGWNGALLKYQELVNSEKPREILQEYLSVMFESGRKLMK